MELSAFYVMCEVAVALCDRTDSESDVDVGVGDVELALR